MINSAKGRLVAFDNKKNLELIGLIFEADGGDKENIIIHVHGNYGNFYNNKFIWKMSEKYLSCGVSFLTFIRLCRRGGFRLFGVNSRYRSGC